MLELFLKVKTFKSLKEVMGSILNGKNFKNPRKAMVSFSVLKTLRVVKK